MFLGQDATGTVTAAQTQANAVLSAAAQKLQDNINQASTNLVNILNAIAAQKQQLGVLETQAEQTWTQLLSMFGL